MMVQLLVSVFGIVFVHRNLSLLEKINVVSGPKLNLFFYLLQLPFYFYLFFKELFVFVFIYIGIFLITFILFDKIIDIFKEKSFEGLHIYIIERIILQIRAGKSAQVSTKNVFDDLTTWQKAIFSHLNKIFEPENQKQSESSSITAAHSYYFDELKIVMCSTGNVIEQLKSYQKALRLQNNLRHKSRQAIQQTKAQALVSFLIYVCFVMLGCVYLKLELISVTMLVSLLLFCTGQVLIFKLGGKIKWKT